MTTIAPARPVFRRGPADCRPALDIDEIAPLRSGEKQPGLAERSSWIETWRKLADTAAAMLEAPLGHRHARRRWVVRQQEGTFAILHVVAGKATAQIPIDPATVDPGLLRALARAGTIELRLDPNKVVRQNIALPAESENFLQPIVEHRLDRLTPWRPENVLYGMAVQARDKDETGILVDFAATSREIAKQAVSDLGRFGIVPTVIGSDADPLEQPVRVDLLAGRGDPRHVRRRRALSRACQLVLPLALACLLCSVYLVARARTELDLAAAGLDTERRAVLARASEDDPRQAARALIAAKQPDATVSRFIDRLAEVIPDGTFLTDLEVDGTSLRLKGRSRNAPGLIPILEAEAELTNVRFEAPVVREPGGGDRFDMVATIERGGTAPNAP